jgi:mannose-6-phosphate isomerase
MYPMKFKPIYKEMIWGGANLEKIFGKKVPSNHTGESWELSSHSNGTSVVANGYLAGKDLNAIIGEYKEKLMGEKFANEKYFPLLIKIIDANDKLSIQVHPDDDHADQVQGEAGKTEAWYVVEAKENAQIVYGIKDHITKHDFIKAVETNRVHDMVNKVAVKSGDMILVPAGTIHTLLDGVVVYEVQQNSDTTYRVYDYNRTDNHGKMRELHTEKAIQVINFGEQPNCIFPDNRIQCQYFSMEKVAVDGQKAEMTTDQFIIYCVVSGSGKILYNESVEELNHGDTVLIPACLGNFTLKGNLELLKIG